MKKTDLLQGTVDMLILRLLQAGPAHGFAIAKRLRKLTDEVIQLGEGSLYPALYRMEERGWIRAEWGKSDSNRDAKFYRLTRAGRKQLEGEMVSWHRLSQAVAKVLQTA